MVEVVTGAAAVVEVVREVADGRRSVGRSESNGGRTANECSDDGSDTAPVGGGNVADMVTPARRFVANLLPPALLGRVLRQLHNHGCLSR